MAAEHLDATLAADLRRLGRDLAVPVPSNDLADQVLARLADAPEIAAPSAWSRLGAAARERWRAIVAALLALVVALLLTPPVRATVADWFGLGGVVVRQDPDAPTGDAAPPPAANGGLRLAEAGALVGFDPVVPRLLGRPDGVEVSSDRRVVSLTWSHPEYGTVRLDQLDGRLSPLFAKTVRDVEYVSAGTGMALWFGEPHEVVVLGADGSSRTEQARLAGHTLVWEHGIRTMRLEGDLTRDHALAIAESAG